MNIDITELVFNGRDNTCVLEFSQDGSPLDSSAITRTLVKTPDGAVSIDSDVDANALTWSGNTLTLSLGDLGISPGVYLVRVVVFDPANPDGLVIQHEESKPRLKLEFVG